MWKNSRHNSTPDTGMWLFTYTDKKKQEKNYKRMISV